MTAKKEGEETRARGNEWEMVSLTDSTYAAACALEEVELKNADNPSIHTDDAGESSNLIRSHHFAYLPFQHELSKECAGDNGEEDRGQENVAEMHATGDQSKGKDQVNSVSEGLNKDLAHNNSNEDKEPQGPEIVAEVHAKGDESKNKDEIDSVFKGLNMEDHFAGMKLADPGDQSNGKDQINSVSEGLNKDLAHNNNNEDREPEGPKIVAEVHAKGDESKNKDEIDSDFKGLNMEDHFAGMKLADPGDDTVSSHDAAFGEGKSLEGSNLDGKEKSIYNVDTKAAIEIPSTYVENLADSEVAASGTLGDVKDLSAAGSYSSKAAEDENSCGSDLPCEAWWKKRAASFYAHAKEANAFWSVFVGAAVLGLVVLGQRWQQERRQVMQHCQHQ